MSRFHMAYSVVFAWVTCLVLMVLMPLFVLRVAVGKLFGLYSNVIILDPFGEWAVLWTSFWSTYRASYLQWSPWSKEVDEHFLAFIPNPGPRD